MDGLVTTLAIETLDTYYIYNDIEYDELTKLHKTYLIDVSDIAYVLTIELGLKDYGYSRKTILILLEILLLNAPTYIIEYEPDYFISTLKDNIYYELSISVSPIMVNMVNKRLLNDNGALFRKLMRLCYSIFEIYDLEINTLIGWICKEDKYTVVMTR